MFIDTGCLLRDPADNSSVIVISYDLARELLPGNIITALEDGKNAEKAACLGGEHAPRLIFATGIGAAGMLYAFTVRVSFEGGKERKITAAVSPTLGAEGIHALTGRIF